MNNRRITFRLSIYIISTTIVAISAIVFLNYKFSKRMLMQHIEESAINKSELIINKINMHVVAVQEITRNVAAQALYYHQHNDLGLFLQNVMQSNQLLNGLHVDFKTSTDNSLPQNYTVFRENGTIKSSSSDDLCVIHMIPEIFTELKKSPNGYWTEPYVCQRDSSLIISFSYPVLHPKTSEITGFVSGEIAMKYFNKVVSGISIGNEGISFLINKSGLFLTHPVDKWILKRNLFDLPQNVLPYKKSTLLELINNGEKGSGFCYPEVFNHNKTWCYFAPMQNTNWIVIILIPEKELFHDLHVVFRQIIVVSMIGVILIFLLLIIILRHTLRPLARITEDIQNFSFGGRKTKAVKNEIISLVESLEELQTRYDEILQEQHQTKKDKNRFEKDMTLAKEIQSNIIPSTFPAFPERDEIDLYAVHKPAQLIGGDLYDYFFIDQTHLLFTIGDVSGKGIPASLFMTVAHTLIKANADVLSSKQIIERINKNLSHRNVNQHFITIFMAILDTETGTLDYCNAAHNYPYIIRNSGIIEPLEETHGLPVGIYLNKEYLSSSAILNKGDMILLYTDGIMDCLDENDHTYGLHRLEETLKTVSNQSCIEVVQKIENNLSLFRGNAPQSDDISMVALRFKT